MIERESTTRVFGQVNNVNDLAILVGELENLDEVTGATPIKLSFRPNNGIDILSITIVKRKTT